MKAYKRHIYLLMILIGVILGTSVLVLSLPAPLLLLSGMLIQPRRVTRKWRVSTRTDDGYFYYNAKTGKYDKDQHTELVIELKGPGDTVKIGHCDIRKDEFSDKAAELKAKARESASILNATMELR